MRPVAIAVALLAVVVVALRLFLPGAKEEHRVPELEPVAEGDWGHVKVFDFRLWLPRGWEHARATGSFGQVFRGPEDDGFMPNVHLYWKSDNKKSLEELVDDYRTTWQNQERYAGDVTLLGEGRDSVAGTPARYLVYETRTKQKDGSLLRTTTKDWFFVRGTKAGILRGISTSRSFMHPYGALFEEVKRRLSYEG